LDGKKQEKPIGSISPKGKIRSKMKLLTGQENKGLLKNKGPFVQGKFLPYEP